MHTQAQNFDKRFIQSFIETSKRYNSGVVGYVYDRLILTDGAIAFFSEFNSFKIAEEINAIIPVLAESDRNFALKFVIHKCTVVLSVFGSSEDIYKRIDDINMTPDDDEVIRICLVRYKKIGFVVSLPSEL